LIGRRGKGNWDNGFLRNFIFIEKNQEGIFGTRKKVRFRGYTTFFLCRRRIRTTLTARHCKLIGKHLYNYEPHTTKPHLQV